MSSAIEDDKNMDFNFDDEVINITKTKDMFNIYSTYREYKAKKVILAVGRSGWRWAHKVFSDFGLIIENDYAKFGIMVETQANSLKDFNKASISLKKDNIDIRTILLESELLYQKII